MDMRIWRSNARKAMREGRHWGNSQETGTEPGLALENRRELVAGDAGVLALRRHSPQTFRPIRTTTRSRRCGSGAACLWDVRVAGIYGIGVAVLAAALPGDMASAADVRCRRRAVFGDSGLEGLNWADSDRSSNVGKRADLEPSSTVLVRRGVHAGLDGVHRAAAVPDASIERVRPVWNPNPLEKIANAGHAGHPRRRHPANVGENDIDPFLL